MNFIAVSTTVFFAILAIGLLFGMFRGWIRSLVRFGCVLLSLLVAVLVAPGLSAAFLKTNADGTTLKLFSFTIDFEKLLGSVSEGGLDFAELFASGSATNELALSLMNIVVNIVLFLAIFLIIWLVSLFVYWIVLLIIKIKTRHDEKIVERNSKYWWLKVLSCFIGVIGSIGICFVVLIPVFGVMNVCDGFLTEETTDEKTANAVSSNNFVCGNLYYTEDKNIGQIESYIQTYAELKGEYDASFLGNFLNFTGLSKAGSATFERLTTVKQGGLKLNFTDEFVQIIKVYNLYKDVFVKQKFDYTNNEHIDALVTLYEEAVKSAIVENYVVELVPKMSEAWSSGEKFLGIANPISGSWSAVVKDTLVVFKIDNINRISQNFTAVANAIKVANHYNALTSLKNNVTVEDILDQNDGLIKDEVLVLTSTNELRENISIILNDAFEILYTQVVGEEKDFGENVLTTEEIRNLNQSNGWVNEANNIQITVNKLFDVYGVVKNDGSSNALINQLQNIGAAIDGARGSKLINKPFKQFITGFITKKVNLKEETKTEILNAINNNWDKAGYSYEKMFKAIQDAAIVAQKLNNVATGDVSLGDLSGALKDIISNDDVKGTVADILSKDIISNMVKEEDKATAEVATDVLEKLVTSDKVNNDTLDADIKAGEQIINVVNDVKKNDGKLDLGETAPEKQNNADKMIADISASEGIMELAKESTESGTGSAITDFTKNVSAEDKAILEISINNSNNDDASKQVLKNLFGIV